MPRYITPIVVPFSVLLLFALGVLACHPDTPVDMLEQNLRLAGKNRHQLEAVLEYYHAPADSLKLRAAEFLITHMDAQYSETTPRTQYMPKVLADIGALTQHQANVYIDSLNPHITHIADEKELVRTEDLQTITAEYLIANIDTAFLAWERAPWRDDLSFDDFCNYVLPYKSGYGVPQHWRSKVLTNYAHVFDDSMPSHWIAAADTFLRVVRPKFRFIHRLGTGADLGAADVLDASAGQCYEWSALADYYLRAFAIPSVTVYSPRWATHNNAGHSWFGLPDSNGVIQSHAANARGLHRFNPMGWGLKTAKIFMRPYAKNPDWVTAFVDDPMDIPPRLRDPRIVDVTARNALTSDVMLELTEAPGRDEEFVYLCVFGRGRFDGIAWGRIEGGKVTFRDMTRDVMYLPAYYRDGAYRVAGDPVMLTYDGEQHTMRVDTTKRSVRIYRKYPLKPSMFRYTRPFKGMTVEISNDSLFQTAVTVDTIRRFPSPRLTDRIRQRDRWLWEDYQDTVRFERPVRTRFLRLKAAPATECIVGDLAGFDVQGNKLAAVARGSKPGAAAVLDGMYGETYHDPDTLGWVALDFGRDVEVSEIRYLPSHDSNSIQVGERYVLHYWDGEWVRLFEQTATHKYFDVEVPSGTIYWLENLDTGKEERIFTIDEAGRQVWW